MSAERDFAPEAASVPAVRRFVLEVAGALSPARRDAVSVMASELATNAVLHARTAFVVRVEHDEGSMRVEVSDSGGGTPEPHRSPPASDLHGRGLLIVETLADSWGVVPSSGARGKSVWFRVDLHEHAVSPAR